MRTLKSKFKLPTGKWLAKQREQSSLTIQQISKAVNWHPLSVRALENSSRVVPPGWNQALGELGIKIPMPAWPRNLPRYSGADLKRDMDMRMRHSRFWLSTELGVSEETISTVVESDVLVPHDWLLKLAELGADVPELVRLTLLQSRVSSPQAATAPAELGTTVPEPTPPVEERNASFCWPPDQPEPLTENIGSKGTSAREDVVKRLLAPAGVDKKQKQSLYVSWTDEGGLHISLSAALLDQIPAVLRDVFLTLSASSLPKETSSPLTDKAAEPGRG